ncbi:hypothetical protein HYY71_05610 [Candidatus Woesearchaeota archaeon]|nr:hypothetical protein [Candidatus Woesearchaeota archaeon]
MAYSPPRAAFEDIGAEIASLPGIEPGKITAIDGSAILQTGFRDLVRFADGHLSYALMGSYSPYGVLRAVKSIFELGLVLERKLKRRYNLVIDPNSVALRLMAHFSDFDIQAAGRIFQAILYDDGEFGFEVDGENYNLWTLSHNYFFTSTNKNKKQIKN